MNRVDRTPETPPRYRLVVAAGEYTADTLWGLMAEVFQAVQVLFIEIV